MKIIKSIPFMVTAAILVTPHMSMAEDSLSGIYDAKPAGFFNRGPISKPGGPNFFERLFGANDPSEDYKQRVLSAALTQDRLKIISNLDLVGIRSSLMGLPLHGLDVKNYWSDEMEKAFLSNDIQDKKEEITKAFLRALYDLSVGRLVPNELDEAIKYTQKPFINAGMLRNLVSANANDPVRILDAMAPQNIYYRSLLETSRRFNQLISDKTTVQIPNFTKKLQLGSQDPAISLIKQRMQFYGHKFTNIDNVFDNEMDIAVRDIQLQLKFKPDGVISPKGKTIDYLRTPLSIRLKQVYSDMEKLRWMPSQVEARHIFVNTAFTQFSLIDRSNPNEPFFMNFKTINGREDRKTPVMKDKIYQVILNPNWTVPPTVFLNDKVEMIKVMSPQGMKKFFEDNHFQVISQRDMTTLIDPQTIDWNGISSADVDFFIQQRPNYMNALGVVKFSLTNEFAIYLHDTNQRELFAEPSRLRSSGCIRLEKPIDLAEYLLKGTEWNREKIEQSVAKVGEADFPSTNIRLGQSSIPVYIMPLTSQMNSDGVMRFVDDVYGFNKLIQTKLLELQD